MLTACSIIPQPSALQWLFSSTSLLGVTGCTPTASPSIPQSFPLKQIPPDCHIRHTAIRQSREGKVEEHQEQTEPPYLEKKNKLPYAKSCPFQRSCIKNRNKLLICLLVFTLGSGCLQPAPASVPPVTTSQLPQLGKAATQAGPLPPRPGMNTTQRAVLCIQLQN